METGTASKSSAENDTTDIPSPNTKEKETASNSSTEIQTMDIPSPNTKEDSVIIDIPEFEHWSRCVIFRVPRMLRDLNEKAYTPRLVSIGPFHHGRKELKGMESHKQEYLREFCKRTCKSEQQLKEFIKNKSKDVWESYAGSINVPYQVFLNLILVDACFIFELFSRFCEAESSKNDYILNTPWFENEIKVDLKMLENQIPFSFLEKLYNFSNPQLDNYQVQQEHPPSTIFLSLAIRFFGFPKELAATNEKVKHFTDLSRLYTLSKIFAKPKVHPKQGEISHLSSATKLDKAGVCFAKAPDEKNWVNVSERRPWCYKFIPYFHSLKLEIPSFVIDDLWECNMRNTILLEQFLYPRKSFVCNFLLLMAELIKTAEDVDLLVEHNIINNLLASNQGAADLINKLCHNVGVPNYMYNYESKQLNDFYKRWYNVTKATLKRVYFKDLWTASSTVVGIFVLIFTTSSTIKSLFFS